MKSNQIKSNQIKSKEKKSETLVQLLGDCEDLEQIKFLVADEASASCSIVRSALRECGFIHIKTVSKGQDAVHAIKNNTFDFIIGESEFSDIGKFELLKLAKSTTEKTQPMFIMLTAECHPEALKHAMQLGVDDFIIKPFVPSKLIHSILRLLIRRKMANQE